MSLTLREALHQAMQAQQSGQLGQALSLYEQILLQAPDQIGVKHLLASAYQQAGRYQEAQRLYEEVIAAGDPQHITDAWNNLGTLFHQTQTYDQAITAFRQALDRDPQWDTAWCNLGLALKELGDLPEAERCLTQALTINADNPQAHYLLGQVKFLQGELEQATGHYRRVISLHPDHIPAHLGLGNALVVQGSLSAAIQQYQQALIYAPGHAGLLHNLAYALARAGRSSEAIAYYWQALRVQPDYAEVHYNLGNLYLETGQLDLAEMHYQQALSLRPDAVDAWVNWGNCALDRGDLEQALGRYHQALDRDANAVMARVQRGFTWLLQGNLGQGLAEYYDHEWCLWRPQPEDPPFPQPKWGGEDLRGRTLLLHCRESGGLGDVIAWSRFLPLLSADTVILETPPELTRLLSTLSSSYPHIQVVPQGSPLPDFDLHGVFNQLPRYLFTTWEALPPPCLPLPPPLELPPTPALRIGLVWAGIPRFPSPYRCCSLPLALWTELFPQPGIQLYSLHKGSPAQELQAHPELEMVDLGAACTDFLDTAQAIMSLDLVITVDTTVVHLAGSLGKPTWLLLPYAPDWRWFLERSDSPWYPSLRLFRQAQPGQWKTVIEHVRTALTNLVP